MGQNIKHRFRSGARQIKKRSIGIVGSAADFPNLSEDIQDNPSILGLLDRSIKQGKQQGQGDPVQFVPRSLIVRGKNIQPRKWFDRAELDELRANVRAVGIIKPLIVRPHPDESGRYELIGGERRWIVSGELQMKCVPVIIRGMPDDREALRTAISDNVHQENLLPLEEAAAYKKLQDAYGCSIRDVARLLGKNTPSGYQQVFDRVRLLRLDPEVQKLMSPETPPAKRLPLFATKQLVKYGPELQVEIATRLSKFLITRKGSVSKFEISAFIRKHAEAAGGGYQPGDRGRTPADDYKLLTLFLERVEREAMVFIDMSDNPFDNMFATRSSHEMEVLLDFLSKSAEKLVAVRGRVIKARNKFLR